MKPEIMYHGMMNLFLEFGKKFHIEKLLENVMKMKILGYSDLKFKMLLNLRWHLIVGALMFQFEHPSVYV